MELFRIAIAPYAKALTGSGSANRWNKFGEFVLYAGSTRSLASLELVVHRAAIKPLQNYEVMVISIADEDQLVRKVHLAELPANWRSLAAYPALQELGSAWYKSKETLLLKVPSAVIIQEYNYVINIGHPDFPAKVNLVRKEHYFWDERLLV